MCGHRLMWFIVGAGAATWYSNHRDVSHAWGCPTRSGANGASQTTGNVNSGGPSDYRSGEEKLAQGTQPETSGGSSGLPGVPWRQQSPTSMQSSPGFDQWAEEKARFMEVSRQVGDTVSEMSEATLDTLSKSIESMKARIAQNRLDRQRAEEEKRLSAGTEEQRNSTSGRLV